MKSYLIYFNEKMYFLMKKIISIDGSTKERLIKCESEIIVALGVPTNGELDCQKDELFKKLTSQPPVI